jgi:O-acetyl-ADP-ribose deacetylase (regulator of RNase III)/RNA recognition motif-containing protein
MCSIYATLKINCSPECAREEAIESTLSQCSSSINLKRIQNPCNQIYLALIEIENSQAIEVVKAAFSIQCEGNELSLLHVWLHDPLIPAVVQLRNPPIGINEDLVETFLESQEIDIDGINSINDVITIKLSESTDLPYLVTKPQTMRQQLVFFEETKEFSADNEFASLDDECHTLPSPPVNLDDNIYLGSNEGSGAADSIMLLIDDLPGGLSDDVMIKNMLEALFNGHIIKKCIIKDKRAYIKFEDSRSVEELVSQPPDDSTILGCPVNYSVIHEVEEHDLHEIAQEPPDAPFLGKQLRFDTQPLLENQNTSILKASPINTSIDPIRPIDIPVKPVHRPVKPVHHPVKPVDRPVKPVDYPVKPVDHPVKPVDHPVKPVHHPVKPVDYPIKPVDLHPVEPVDHQKYENTDLIRPIDIPFEPVDHLKYEHVVPIPKPRKALSSELPQLSFKSNDSSSVNHRDPVPHSDSPHVLVVDNMPDGTDSITAAFTYYLKTTTKNDSITSCKIENGRAYVEFEDPTASLKIAQEPPGAPFLGKQLRFDTQPLSENQNTSILKASPINTYTDLIRPIDIPFEPVDHLKYEHVVPIPKPRKALSSELPQLSFKSNDSSSVDHRDPVPHSDSPHVLVVDNMPDGTDSITAAFTYYLKTTTKNDSITSCKIENGRAYVEFEDPTASLKIAQEPPGAPFLGKQLRFDTQPLLENQNTSILKESPINTSIDPIRPIDIPVKPVHRPVKPVHHPVKPVDYPVKPVDHPVKPVDHPVKPVHHPVKPVDHPVKPVHHPVKPVDHPVKPVHHPVKPVDYPIKPVDLHPVEPVDHQKYENVVPIPKPRKSSSRELPKLSFDSNDSSSVNYPEPHPDSPVYAWPSVRVSISSESLHYYKQNEQKLKDEIQHGEVFISDSLIEVKPLPESNTRNTGNWSDEVKDTIAKYKRNFDIAEVKISPLFVKKVIDTLEAKIKFCPDLSYTIINNDVIRISGSYNAVHQAEDELKNMQLEYTVTNTPQCIDYLLKFTKAEIATIQPQVNVRSTEHSLVFSGMMGSLDKAAAVVDSALRSMCKEVINLTAAAYKLLSSGRSFEKITELVKNESVVWAFNDKITHNLEIRSPDAQSCSIAKETISKLIVCLSIKLEDSQFASCNGDDWDQLLDELMSNYFVHISFNNDTASIALTGEDECLEIVSQMISSFLEAFNVTERITVNREKWSVLSKAQKSALDEILSMAKKNNINVTLPDLEVNLKDYVCIAIHGIYNCVKIIKDQLIKFIESKTLTRDVSIPLLHELSPLDVDFINSKCQEIEQQYGVAITFDIASNTETSKPFDLQPSVSSILHATSPNGIKLHIYCGDPTKKPCSSLAVFVSEIPKEQEHPNLIALATAGGLDVQNGIETSLKHRDSLITATVHKSRKVGNLPCEEIVYVVLSPYNSTNSTSTAKTALQELFHQLRSPNVVLIPFTASPHNYPIELYAQFTLSAVSRLSNEDVSVSLFVDEEMQCKIFHEKMKFLGYEIHSYSYGKLHPHQVVSKPKIKKDHLKVVKISKGNLLDVKVDVYVNTTDASFRLDCTPLAVELERRCGQALVDETASYITALGQLNAGQVIRTSANNIKADSIYHIVLPHYSALSSRKLYRLSIQNMLSAAKEYGDASIGMCCLGFDDKREFPPEEATVLLLDEVLSFVIRNPGVFSLVHIVASSDRAYESLVEEYDKRIESFIKKQLQTPEELPLKSNQNQAQSAKGNDSDSLTLKLLIKNNIVEVEADVLVNCTSLDMKPDANEVSKAIVEAAGFDMEFMCQAFVDQGILLNDAMIVPMNASGILRCSKVYQVHIPPIEPPSLIGLDTLENVITNCLKKAEEEQHSSLLIHSFFCIYNGKVLNEAAAKLLEAIKKFAKMNPLHLKEIIVVTSARDLYAQLSQICTDFLVDIGTNGVYNISKSQEVRSVDRSQPEPVKFNLLFKLLGLTDESLSDANQEIKMFTNNLTINDTIDLKEIHSLTNDITAKIYSIAYKYSVEAKIQNNLERVLITGGKMSVDRACDLIQRVVLSLSKEHYKWSVLTDNGAQVYNNQISLELEVAYRRNKPIHEMTIDREDYSFDIHLMKVFDSFGANKTLQRSI